jgi:LysM repeat protein
MRTKVRHVFSITFVMALVFSAVGSAAAAPTADGPNLLENPGFESPYVKQCCQTDLTKYYPNTLIGEVQVANGWSGWWLQPDQDPQHPSAGSVVDWHRPEWREANCGPVCANRVHGGGNAQKYFTFWSVHEAGMFQQVSGIAPGTRLRFSAYMQAWSTNAAYGLSDHNQTMDMRVGIDPFGGTDGFSPNIIWSDAFDTFDVYGLYSIEATAQAGTVTVFTHSAPHYANQHNDIYVDDASLVAVDASTSGGGNTGNNPPVIIPVALPPTPEPTQVTGFNYTVVRGDNYYSIARRFGITLSQLLEVNHVANPQILFVGVVLLIPSDNPPPDNSGGVPVDNNPAPQPTVAPTATTSPADLPGAFAYVVVRGDNLFRLSLRFGVSIARIKQLNGLVSDIIFIGQTLIIAP